jgi:sortase A
VGEILVTLGLVILLFCVYQLFYTNLESNRAQAKIKNSLERGWKPAERAPDAKPVREDFAGVSTGQAFALMHIPRLGLSWEKPILEGVSLDELAKGIGHYPDSAMPGKIGNFAVAGHRATHGEPFRDLNKLRQGDVVIVETENNWYRYVIDSNQIVDPTDVEVVLPVPNRPGVKPTEKLITLTTCNPRWASTERLIYWGHLVSVMSKAAGTPAELRS